MGWNVPGTVLEIHRSEADGLEEKIRSLFLAGGMVLSQVSNLTGLEPYTVQNWVKRGFLPPPTQKRYTITQLCRLMNINLLRASLPLESICSLLSFVNGRLDDNSDDLIDDAELYFLFLRLAARAKELDEPALWDRAMDEALENYREPVSGARERVEKELRVMMTAWIAAKLRHKAEELLRDLHEATM